MKKVTFAVLGLISIAGSFFTAFVAASWSAVPVTIPAKLTGTIAGSACFVLTAVLLFLCISIIMDLLFYKFCRRLFADMFVSEWNNWRIFLSAAIPGCIAGYFFGLTAGFAVVTGGWIVVLAGMYVFGRAMVLSELGVGFLYRD